MQMFWPSIPITIQLHSVRDAAMADLPGTLRQLSEIGYKGVELAGTYGYSAEELKGFLDDADLICIGSHVSLCDMLGSRFDSVAEYNKIIGNLPYNITTEAIVYILLNARRANKVVIMCQSEAFNHFNDVSGKEYGPASVLLHLLGTCNKKFVVKPGSFYPVPKCNSTVFTIDLYKNVTLDDIKKVYLFAKQLFINRRKTIYNNLSQYLKDKEKTNEVLNQVDILPNTRPEEISPEKYLEMYKAL